MALLPPCNRGMTILKRSLFEKIVKIPKLRVHKDELNKIIPHTKKYLLKMEKLKPVQIDQSDNNFKLILLNPTIWSGDCDDNLPGEVREKYKIEVVHEDLTLSYENWSSADILKAILPENQETVSSFSRIGHIIHLNLKEHLLPYKKVIGEVLNEKTAGCRTVVNKIQTIDNTYRNFQFELLDGDPDYFVSVRENGVGFDFDFAMVYWNPRLSQEHENIVNLLRMGDVLYDVMAGVGPFAVPAGKKKCWVLANDLNPHSFKYLEANVRKNKVEKFVKTFNSDGNEFIRAELRDDLISRWNSTDFKTNPYRIHITMNLPAMAVEFLPSFHGLLRDYDGAMDPLPLVHVYCFAKGVDDPKTIAKALVEEHLMFSLADNLEGIHFVRNVAPNKNMMRVSFSLTKEILFSSNGKRKLSDSFVGEKNGGDENAPKIKCKSSLFP